MKKLKIVDSVIYTYSKRYYALTNSYNICADYVNPSRRFDVASKLRPVEVELERFTSLKDRIYEKIK